VVACQTAWPGRPPSAPHLRPISSVRVARRFTWLDFGSRGGAYDEAGHMRNVPSEKMLRPHMAPSRSLRRRLATAEKGDRGRATQTESADASNCPN